MAETDATYHVSAQTQVPIEFHIPQGTESRFSTHIAVQLSDHEVFLNFFEVMPPIRFNSAEAVPTTVVAECVARIALARARFGEFAEVISRMASQIDVVAGEVQSDG